MTKDIIIFTKNKYSVDLDGLDTMQIGYYQSFHGFMQTATSYASEHKFLVILCLELEQNCRLATEISAYFPNCCLLAQAGSFSYDYIALLNSGVNLIVPADIAQLKAVVLAWHSRFGRPTYSHNKGITDLYYGNWALIKGGWYLLDLTSNNQMFLNIVERELIRNLFMAPGKVASYATLEQVLGRVYASNGKTQRKAASLNTCIQNFRLRAKQQGLTKTPVASLRSYGYMLLP